jgi:hypothetical protein
MKIKIAKVRLVKSIGGLHCELLLIAPFLFFKFLHKPKYILSFSINQTTQNVLWFIKKLKK